jgi:hypothetical protein
MKLDSLLYAVEFELFWHQIEILMLHSNNSLSLLVASFLYDFLTGPHHVFQVH